MDLSKFDDKDYEQLKRGNIQGLSDAGYQLYKQQHQQYQQASQQASNPQTTADPASKAAQGGKPGAQPEDQTYWGKLKSGLANAQAAGDSLLHPSLSQEKYSQWQAQHAQKGFLGKLADFPPRGSPEANEMENWESLAVPQLMGAMGGMGPLTKYMAGRGLGPAVTRLGTGTAVGAGMGAASDSESPGMGAIKGGLTGAAIGSGMEALPIVSNLLGKVGGWMSRMSPQQLEAFQKNPDLANQAYKESVDQGPAWENRIKGMHKQATEGLQAKVDQNLEKLKTAGPDRELKLSPQEFEGTAAHDAIQNSWNRLQTRDLDIPTYEVNTPQYTPIEPTMKLGKGQEQAVPIASELRAKDPYAEAPKTTLFKPERGWEASSKEPVDMPQVLTPQGSQTVAATPPLPQTGVGLPWQDVLEARAAAGEAGKIRTDTNGLVTPTSEKTANLNRAAGGSLQSILHAASPEAEALDSQIHDMLLKKQELERTGSLDRLFSPGENNPQGTRGIRRLANYADQETGTNFGETADALSAASQLNAPTRVHGLFSADRLLKPTIGRPAVRTSAYLEPLANKLGRAHMSLFTRE